MLRAPCGACCPGLVSRDLKVFYVHADALMISLTVATWPTTTVPTITTGKAVGDLLVLYMIYFVYARYSLLSVSVKEHWRVFRSPRGGRWP